MDQDEGWTSERTGTTAGRAKLHRQEEAGNKHEQDSQLGDYRPLDDVQTFETAISITLAVTPEQAALIAIIDAMKDDEGQYRVLTRRQGERGAVDGAVTWTLDDVFTLN